MSAAHIALLGDDPASRRRLRSVLSLQNYFTYDAPSGAYGLPFRHRSPVDLVIMDVCGCVADLSDLLYALRSSSDVAVIVLARNASEAQRIAALDAGADDFLTYPFSNSELLARIRVVLRRRPAQSRQWNAVELDGVRIDLALRRVVDGARHLHLTPKETDLLVCLLENQNVTVPHSGLLRAVWAQPAVNGIQSMRVPPEFELEGLDVPQFGLAAYPEDARHIGVAAAAGD